MRLPFSRALGVSSDPESATDADRATTADSDAEPPTDSVAEPSADPDARGEAGTGPGLAARVAEGAKGGLVATLAMTAYRLPVSRSLPPTAQFWTKFVAGGDPDDHPVPAVVLHLCYGVAAGAVYGLLAPAGSRREPEDHRGTARLEAVGLLTGVIYALALSVVGERVLLERLLDERLRSDERLVFHAGHVVYGLGLGTWVGSRTGDRR